MLDDMEGKGKSDSSSTLRYKLEQEEKIRKHYLEKFNGDEIKAKKATMEALAKIEEQENKKNKIDERICNIGGEGRNRGAGGPHNQRPGRGKDKGISRRARVSCRHGRSRDREALHTARGRTQLRDLCGVGQA